LRQAFHAQVDVAIEAVEAESVHQDGGGVALPEPYVVRDDAEGEIGFGRAQQQTVGVLVAGIALLVADPDGVSPVGGGRPHQAGIGVVGNERFQRIGPVVVFGEKLALRVEDGDVGVERRVEAPRQHFNGVPLP
jgi:hypothetical protein